MTPDRQPELPACLAAMCAELDRFRDPIPPAVLHSGMLAVDLDLASLGTLLRFDSQSYCRNLVHRGPSYEALVLCWRPGQASPIHDHGGSSCAFRIVEGAGSESMFALGEGGAHPTGRRTLSTGTVCSSRDEEIHELANHGAGDLVTLHVYSPALDHLRTYRRAPGTESRAVA